MRGIVTGIVPALPVPAEQDRLAANAGPSTQAEHDRWKRDWACMNAVELNQPSGPVGSSVGTIEVAAWNIERCKHVEASAALLAERGADLVLATEMDWGCARSAQRHTTAELAAGLGCGYVFGVEFVELAIGDARETAAHAGESNLHGLHGNAILSRHPMGRAALIPLDEGGRWFTSDLKQGQRRIGGRNAVAAEILLESGSFWAVSVHFESESTAAMRADSARCLLAGLAGLTGDAPVVVGGDFNCFQLSIQNFDDAMMFAAPEKAEPFFEAFREAGFTWRGVNAPGVTTRLHPWQVQDKMLLKIDWLFVRGFSAERPWIAPAVGTDGLNLSDHEVIGACLWL
jgi:endonuclease/exonuclease/phosphatase family metal-dependent hydrolase